MANDIAGSPWVLDTPNASVILWRSRVNIEHVEFVSYASQGSVVELRDINGRTIWLASGANDLTEVRSGKIGWVDGLVLAQCENGGKVLVYVK